MVGFIGLPGLTLIGLIIIRLIAMAYDGFYDDGVSHCCG